MVETTGEFSGSMLVGGRVPEVTKGGYGVPSLVNGVLGTDGHPDRPGLPPFGTDTLSSVTPGMWFIGWFFYSPTPV